MKKAYLIPAILLLSTVWLAAQTTPSSSSPAQQPSAGQSSPSSASPSQTSPSQSTAPDASQTSAGSSSVEGCLAGSAGSYTLTDSTGKTWQLAGDTSKLSDHVGHQVRITGSDNSSAGGSASSPSGAGSSASGGAGAGGSQPTFNVSKVKMISSSCPTPSK